MIDNRKNIVNAVLEFKNNLGESTLNRSTQFTLVKAIAIICVVLSHAGASGWLFNFVFIFHVPVFFLCSGYFFNTKYLNDERTFLMHRIKGLYLPFLRWSLFFLVIHNLMFYCGVLSEQFGNAEGGVTHPFTWHQFGQHLWSIVVNMSGYDQFLCGSFWFFRALLLSSVGFLILFKLLHLSERLQSNVQVGWGVLIIALILTTWKVGDGIVMTGVAQGGYRELMGIVFMAAGFILRQYNVVARLTWKIAIPCAVLVVLAAFFFPSSMKWNPSFVDFVSLPIPAIAAFIALIYVCGFLDKGRNWAKQALVYIGDRTLYVFAFHLVAFKFVSALKVAFYGLPWDAVGSFPTIFNPQSNVLWVLLYVIVGVGLPLLWLAGYRLIADKVNLTEKQLVNGVVVVGQYICKCCSYVCRGIMTLFVSACMNVWNGVKDIIDASSTKEE